MIDLRLKSRFACIERCGLPLKVRIDPGLSEKRLVFACARNLAEVSLTKGYAEGRTLQFGYSN